MPTRAPVPPTTGVPAAAALEDRGTWALDAATALADSITRERVALEAARHARRALGVDAVAVGLASWDDPSLLVLAAQAGLEGDAEGAAAIGTEWPEAIETRQPVHGGVGGRRITAPMVAEDAVMGVLTAVLPDDPGDSPGADRLAEHLATIAAQAALAVRRADAVHRVAQRRRLDAIDEVATGLAHELRNPLFGISSAAQLLRFRVTEDPVVEKNVGRVLREVERLNTMVTALLEYGRTGALRLADADPDGVWDEVLERQRGRLESKALHVDRARAAGLTSCPIDRQRLEQVFTNLLENAVDAAPEGTDLSLESSALPSGAWRMRLINAGQPLAADARDRAFDLFFSTKPGGTGIGLPLCRRIVEEHGGTIRLEHDATGRTTAIVTLPPSAPGDASREEHPGG